MSVSAVSATNCRYVPDAAIEMEEPKLKMTAWWNRGEGNPPPTQHKVRANKTIYNPKEQSHIFQTTAELDSIEWFSVLIIFLVHCWTQLIRIKLNSFENKVWTSVKIISFSLCPQCPHCDTMRNSTVSTVSQCPGPNTFLFHARWQRKAAWLRLMWPWKERWKIMMFCDVNSIPSRLIGWCNKLTHGVKL